MQIINPNWPSTKWVVPLFLVDPIDGLTPVTGENGGQPYISFDGGAFNATTNTLNEISNGYYFVMLDETEVAKVTGTLIIIRYASVNCAEAHTYVRIYDDVMQNEILSGFSSIFKILKDLGR